MQLLGLKTESNKQQTISGQTTPDGLGVLVGNRFNSSGNLIITFTIILVLVELFELRISSYVLLSFFTIYSLNVISDFDSKLIMKLLMVNIPTLFASVLHISLIGNFGLVNPGVLLLQMSLSALPWVIFEMKKSYLYFSFFIAYSALILTYFYSGSYSPLGIIQYDLVGPVESASCFAAILLFSLVLIANQKKKLSFEQKNKLLVENIQESENELSLLFNEAKSQSERIHKLNKELELKALRAQMSPHFIFNALNSIQHMLSENEGEEAMLYLLKFAKLVRSVLEKSPSSSINLDTEVKFLTNYLDLEKLRFENQFQYNLMIDKDLDLSSIMVPFLLIQPYVENAILHGLVNKKGNKQLSISFCRDTSQQKLICIVDDNGIGRTKALEIKNEKKHHHESKGMALIDKRLSLLNYGMNEKISVDIIDKNTKNGKPAGTRIKIEIPLKFEYND